MCFSPQADFAGGLAVAAVGAGTLRLVRAPRELIIGSLPLLLGAHQFVEGFVWLGLRGQISSDAAAIARQAYIVFAYAVLPALVPIGFLLLEPRRERVRWLWPFAVSGVLLAVYLLWEVTAFPVAAHEQGHCIDYVTHAPNEIAVSGLYVLVTCGPALISSRRYLRWFGLVNLAGVVVVAAVRAEEFTSLWCVYAALVSVLILAHFRRQRASERLPPDLEPVLMRSLGYAASSQGPASQSRPTEAAAHGHDHHG
jgi:nitroreductase